MENKNLRNKAVKGFEPVKGGVPSMVDSVQKYKAKHSFKHAVVFAANSSLRGVKRRGNPLVKAAIVAAFAGLTTFCAPADAEVIPDPTSEDFTHNVFTLTESTTQPSSNYIILYDIDKTVNPWTVDTKYYNFALDNDYTSFVYGNGPYTDLSTNVNVPNGTESIIVKYTTSQNHTRITSLSENISNTVFASRSGSNGGAIKNTGSGNYNISNTAFLSNNNSGSGHGGAVYNSGKLGNITDSVFISNYVTGGGTCGGAIANAANATIGNIKNNIFIGNSNKSGTDSGGTIINLANATMGDIENNVFISNESCYAGGVLFVSAGGKVNSIKSSVFINNTASTGGVIGMKGNITEGISDSVFIGNYAHNNRYSSTTNGGGVLHLYMGAKIGDIKNSIFISNSTAGRGGVINTRNDEGEVKINSVQNSLFLNNSASKNGGVIYNEATITNGISNSTFISNSGSYGGAIYNINTINGITNTSFLNNRATSSYGGAIYTSNALTFTADSGKTMSFQGNTAASNGGAIYSTANLTFNANNGTILFQNNTANSVSNAIYISSNSKKVTFSLNNGSVYMYDKINGSSGYDVAINGNDKTQDKFYMYNDIQNADVTTSKVTLDMQDSSHEGHSYSLLSFNPTNTDAKIDINFANNTADKITTTNKSDGTLIINDFLISGTTPTTIADGYKLRILTNNNSTSSLKLELSNAAKAQLENEYLVGDKNITKTDVADANEIWDKELYEYSDYSNYDTLGLVKTGNTYDSIGKIHIEGGTKTLIDTLNSSNKLIGVRTFATTNAEKVYDVLSNLDNSGEGMMYVTGATDGTNVSTIKGHNFKLFTITDETILNVSDVKIQDGLTTGNGGAINNAGIVNLNNVTFADNTAGGEANDIHNTGVVNVKTGTTTINGGITGTGVINVKDNGSLVVSDDSNGITQNSLTITSGSVKANAGKLSVAGGISNADTLEFTGGTNENIVSGTGATVISGDVTNNASITQDNLTISTTGALSTKLSDLAISTNTIKNDGILNLTNEEEIALDITKDTTGTGKIAINTTSTKISGTISDNTIELNHGTLTFANPGTNIANADLTINGCMLNLIDNSISPLTMGTLTLNNDVELAVDVDLKNETMDRLNASSYVLNDHKINVVGMNILTDATKNNTKILFADNDIKDSVVNHVSEIGKGVSNLYQTSAYSPLYKYNVTYSSQSDGGYYNFQTDGFNPAVVATPIASQANVMAVSNIVNNYAFAFVDNAVRNAKLSSRYNNRYAVQETIPTDLNTNKPLFVRPEEESVWVKPFVTFENIPLRNGPKLNAINYGTIIGYDSNPIYLKHGWDGVITGYVGYTGSSMHYTGVDDVSNGGLLGATFSLFKGNFFNATTLTAGAMLDQMTTMYGKDNVTSLYAGIGNKTGYNFNFKEDLFTVQPSLLMSYTFANTFDFTNAAGVRINADPINVIQLSPGLKFFMNAQNGWQPYLSVNMMWNIMGNTHVKANGVQLPSMSVKPYVQYGIGIQKTVKDHFTGYAQAMMQNGGRNGISLTMGFKWALGRDKKVKNVSKPINIKKAENKPLNTQGQKHVLKSL